MAPNSTSDNPTNPNVYLEIPKWVNEDYFQEIISKDVPDYVRIIKFTPVAATAPGENYTSIMVRVVMDIELKDGNTKQVSYILKTALESTDQGAAFVTSMNLFPKEQQMYQTMIPQFEQLYKEAGAVIQLGPRCLTVENTPERITLVMEDLKTKHFENADRLKGLNKAQMDQVLRKLAELHAASAVYQELNGPYDAKYKLSFFAEANRAMYEAMAADRHKVFIKAMRQWGLENVEHYIAKMPDNNKFFDEALRVNDVDPEEFNVLNHGDCWVNNIMFKYKENGDIDETLFVDFQMGKWGTPAQDLWYFIASSASLDIKLKEFDHFIYIYHDHLVECLKMLKYSKPIPTLKDLHVMMLKYGFWGFFTTNGVLSAILLPSDKDSSIENMIKPGAEGDELRYKTFVNPYYARAASQLYPFLENKGILDFTPSS